jgi:hypothetical protein
MQLTFILFIFLNIILILGATYRFYSSGQEFGALIVLGGLVAASVIFGLRWFTGSGEMANAPGPWPPVLNTCPDFLTLHTMGTGTTAQKVCIDTVGVAKGGTSKMEKWTSSTQTDEKYKFNLHTNKSGQERIDALCEECAAKGVTWEGVYNGVTCLGREPPAPRA